VKLWAGPPLKIPSIICLVSFEPEDWSSKIAILSLDNCDNVRVDPPLALCPSNQFYLARQKEQKEKIEVVVEKQFWNLNWTTLFLKKLQMTGSDMVQNLTLFHDKKTLIKI